MIWSMYFRLTSADSEGRHIMKFRKTYKRKQAAVLLSVFLLVTSVAGCQRVGAVKETGEEKVNVVTTIFPQYDFVRQIAGDNVEVSMLLKPGEETHSYEPTPQDILKIQNCDLFIYVGGENDEWVEDILDSIDTEHIRLLRLIDCVDTVNEEHVEGMKEERGHEHEEEEEHEHEHGEEEHETHETLTPDEHVWTSLRNASAAAEVIADALAELDPENSDIYKENLRSYQGELSSLDNEYQKTVDQSTHKTLLFADRFPFRYLVDDYGISYYAAFSGCSAESEASFKTITFLAKKVDELGLKEVFTIEKSDDRIAETVIENTRDKDQKVAVLNSMQSITSEEIADGTTYLSIMEDNLKVLKAALK